MENWNSNILEAPMSRTSYKLPFNSEFNEKFLNVIYCVHHNNCPMWGDLIDKHHLLYLNCILWVYQKIIVAYLWDWDHRVPHLFPLQPLGLQFNIDQNFTVVHIVHYLLSTFSPIKMKKRKDNWNYVWENNLFWTFWHSSSHSRRDHTCTLPRLGPQTWGGPRKPPTGCSGVEHPWLSEKV